ncbi:hypothetical protein CGRA01v4_09167 [Colletotrichum graminicola]|uniref:HNH nuclease domain-containing protein n=1 Tax=Colletotrichum graminicola (strain M1.001 / M2 / FGSC 10212) TaxID=645133 RepID=E3Q6Y9_COLGM|nr:uncharacterized protein GLRG_02447 [Colletotrichum graminicola M1.001]EFQ26627.1 hypothetical protein GLRG_02447 [Colletotrichum graminicola M1.001]WDK17882.1 hypothetical protein CGRA01v4_09167 [Colletotrichum graminicola]
MNTNLPLPVSSDKVDRLCESLRNKLENADPYTRVTNRDIEMYERNFAERVPRNMDGRVDYLDDGQATLGCRREVMKEIHQIIQRDKDLQKMVCNDLFKKTLASARCWAVLLTMEWTNLVEFRDSLCAGDAKQKQRSLHGFLMACCNVGGLIWWMSETPTSTKEQIWLRSGAQREAAPRRDGFRCVLTHSAIIEECHMCPFWSLSRRTEIQRTVIAPLMDILGLEFSNRILGILEQTTPAGERTAPGDFDLLDSPANMITLSNQLHKLWDDGVFGLEPIRRLQQYKTVEKPDSQEKPGSGPSAVKRGAEASEHQPPHKKAAGKQTKSVDQEKLMYGIELRFHWLRKTTLGGLDDSPPTVDADPRELWKEWDADNVRDNAHATPLDNGHTVTIWSDDRRKIPNWDLVSIQWLAFRLHRLSGAANVDLYAPQKDQDDDEALAARVLQAKRDATEMVAERLGLNADELWADPRGPYYVPPENQGLDDD